MKTDTIMTEIWRVKDELGAQSAWNPRVIKDDPIVAEVRRIRQELAQERADSPLFLKDEPRRKS